MIQTEVLSDVSGLMRLAPAWNQLLNNSDADTIFLTWEWIESWIESSPKEIHPFAIAAWNESGVLVGLAPYHRMEYVLGRCIRYRFLRIMGDYATGAEYPDWILRKGQEEEAAQAISSALSKTGKEWDCIWMPNMSGWTGGYERILKVLDEVRYSRLMRPIQFAYFELPDDAETYNKRLAPKFRYQIRTHRRKIEGYNGARFCRCEGTSEIPFFLDALFDLHRRRWAKKGVIGTFERKPAEERFYRIFLPRAFDKGWLRLYGMAEGKVLKAVQVGYVYHSNFFSLQEGFDPEYVRGIGHVLRARVIESLIAEGVRGYDFLGDMTDHKSNWRACVRNGHDLYVGRRSLRTYILFAKGIWPSGRFLELKETPGETGATATVQQGNPA